MTPAATKRLPLLARAARRILAWYDFSEPFNAAGGRKRRPGRIEHRGEESEQLTPWRRLVGVDLARNMVRNSAPTRGIVRQMRVNTVGIGGKLSFAVEGEWYAAATAVFAEWARHADYIDHTPWRELLQDVVYALAMEGDCVVAFDRGQFTGSGKLVCFEADQICNLAGDDWKKFAVGPRRRWRQCSGILLDGWGRKAGVIVSRYRGRIETARKDAFVFVCDPDDPDAAPWRHVTRKFRLRQLRGSAPALASLSTTQDAHEMMGYELQSAKRGASHYAAALMKDPAQQPVDAAVLPTPESLAGEVASNNTPAGTAGAAAAACAPDAPGATDDGEDELPRNLVNITGGQFDMMEGVEKLEWDPATRPNERVVDFLEFSTRLAGRAHGLNSSYALGRADGSYSAARMDLCMSWIVFEDNQKFLESALADWVAVRVISRAIERKELAAGPEGWETRIRWQWPKPPAIDEQKEQAALTQKFRNGAASPQEVFGPNWRETLRLRAEFDAECKRLGITLAFQETTPGATTSNTNTNTDET